MSGSQLSCCTRFNPTCSSKCRGKKSDNQEGDWSSPSSWGVSKCGSPDATTTEVPIATAAAVLVAQGRRLQVSAPSAAARDGVLHLTMTTITRPLAPAADGFLRLGSRAALNHCHHWMTGCRPHQEPCHQAFSYPQSLMLTVRSLASAPSTARCGSALTTSLFAIAKMTGTGWMLGAPNSLSRQAGTLLSFLTFTQIGNGLPISRISLFGVLVGLLFVLISATCVRLTSFQIFSWNPGLARGSDSSLLGFVHQRSMACDQRERAFWLCH